MNIYKNCVGEIRIFPSSVGGTLTFTLKKGDILASYEITAKDAKCEKEVEDLVNKISEYKL